MQNSENCRNPTSRILPWHKKRGQNFKQRSLEEGSEEIQCQYEMMGYWLAWGEWIWMVKMGWLIHLVKIK